MDDRAIVERQLGRPPRAFRRVVCRCPFGAPAVTEQAPYDDEGEPFPTTYYLTCPHLVAAVARIEAVGGVERWSAAVTDDPALTKSLDRASVDQRELRRELALGERGRDGGASLVLGIAGSNRPERLKCLHAHVAFALARPGYELGERMLAELRPLWPKVCCTQTTAKVHRSPERRVATNRPPENSSPSSGRMSVLVESARQEWGEAYRRLEGERHDRARYERLLAQVDAVAEELRRRLGQTFTLAELADVYAGAERWSREAIAERAPRDRWAQAPATVEGAAFYLYSRGAADYIP